MADQKIVSEEALTAIASDIKTAIGAKADSSNVYTKSATDTLLEGKANTEGEYDSLVVGNAKQLVSTVGETDKVPYLFRKAGGSIDIGDRETDELVGGSVAWNQLVDFTNSSIGGHYHANNTFEIQSVDDTSGTTYPAINLNWCNGHKYLGKLENTLQGGENPNVRIFFDTTYTKFKDAAVGTTNAFVIAADYTTSPFLAVDANNAGGKIRLNIFDLTQMFGATIADYIYSLEQATAGAGVAWFKRLFNKPYYAYNAGELMSVKTSGHKLVGFNAWDGETESGYIYNGTYYPSNDYWRTKNFIKVVPNTTYYFKVPSTNGQINFFDIDQNYIGKADGMGARLATTPDNCYYIKFYQPKTSVASEICVNISWDGERNGEYEPYEANTYPLDSDLELRGIPKLDADNKLYYDGDTYSSDGSVSRRYAIVDLGSLTWTKQATAQSGKFRFSSPLPNAKTSDTRNGVYSISTLVLLAQAETNIATYDGYTITSESVFIFLKAHETDETGASIKAALSGVYLVYGLIEPTSEQAEPFTNPQIVNDFGTEEYIDNRAVPIPVGHNTFYEVNLRAKLEMSPDSPESNGDYLMRHTNEGNAYTPYVNPIPSLPSTDGNYVLKCNVSGSTKTLTWVEET